jgi:hypothetical protein
MRIYTDHNFKEIKVGYYNHAFRKEEIYYFTGKYNNRGLPVFYKDGDEVSLTPILTAKLKKINQKELRTKINKSKKRNSWLEKKLKE